MKKIIFLVLIFAGFSLQGQSFRLVSAHVSGNRFLSPQSTAQRPDDVSINQYFMENFDSGIPSTWTVTDVAGNGVVWSAINNYNGSTLDGTPFVMVDSDAAGSVDVDTYLESPVITINNGGAPVFLTFDHYFEYYSGGNNEVGDVEVFDGTNWQVVASYTGQDYGYWGSPDKPLIDVTGYVNPNFKVRFHYYNANYDWYWSVDNVQLYSPDAHDLALVWGIPGVAVLNDHMFFSTIVQNLGYQTQNNFSVDVTVRDASSNVVFTDTYNVTGANLAMNEYYKINFTGIYTPTMAGNYTVTYRINTTDDDPSNNIFTVNTVVKDFNYLDEKIYTFIAYDGDSSDDLNDVGYFNPSDGAYTRIDSISGMNGDFLTGGDFIKGLNVLGVSDNWNNIYMMDGDGTAYWYGYYPFLSDAITGIADSDAGSYFSTLTSLYEITPFLDTIKVGDYNVSGVSMIGIAADTTGILYGIDLASDKLYRISSSDASLTEIGSLGLDINYAQDIGIDPVTNVLYGTLLYDDGTNYLSGLYEIDTSTGAATLVGSQQVDEYTVCAVSPGPSQVINQLPAASWKLYPNPASDVIHLTWPFVPDRVEISDLSGKIIYSGVPVDNQMSVDVSTLHKGVYMMRIIKGDRFSVKMFSKR